MTLIRKSLLLTGLLVFTSSIQLSAFASEYSGNHSNSNFDAPASAAELEMLKEHFLVNKFQADYSSLFFSSNTNSAAAQSGNELCSMDHEDFKTVIFDQKNRLSFTNPPGSLKIGLCWWHSRLQRAATYLAIYRPDLPKPNSAQVSKILKDLRKLKKVVTIPGYSNLWDFSRDFEAEFTKMLSAWQLSDSIFKFGWVRGLAGKSKLKPNQFKSDMDELFVEVEGKGRIAYQMLQVKGLVAHAWLVISMTPTRNGYTLEVVDSNSKKVYNVNYKYGSSQIKYSWNVVPHLRRTGDFKKISKSLKKFCSDHGASPFVKTESLN
jgi:hypothetical protein